MTIILIIQEVYWGFKRDEVVNNADVTSDDNAPLFKYKAGLITNTKTDGTEVRVKTAITLNIGVIFRDH